VSRLTTVNVYALLLLLTADSDVKNTLRCAICEHLATQQQLNVKSPTVLVMHVITGHYNISSDSC